MGHAIFMTSKAGFTEEVVYFTRAWSLIRGSTVFTGSMLYHSHVQCHVHIIIADTCIELQQSEAIEKTTQVT